MEKVTGEEGLKIVRRLVAIVARVFYSDKYIIVLDYLNVKERAREDEISRYLQIPVREVHKICGQLREEKILRSQSRLESRKAEQRAVSRTYYFLDYKLFVDVVKWRMWKLQESIKNRMEVERSKQGYICPNCGSEYSTMQALSLVDYATGLFKCEFCSAVLEDNTKSELSTQAQQILSKLMDQCAPILNVLKLTDNIILPPHTPFDQVVPPDNLLLEDQRFRYDQRASEDMINSLNEGEDSNRDALEGSGTGSGKDNVIVEFGEDMSLEQAVQKREEKIKLKRKQNALPPWHVWSTVSNSLMVPEYLIPLELNKKAKSENSNNEKGDSNVEIKRIYQYYESLSRAINPKDAPLQSPATVTTGATTEITTASTDDAGDKSGTDGVRLFDSFIVAASPSSSKSSDTSIAEKKTDELNSGENIKPFRLVVTQLVNNMSNGLSLDPKKLLDSNYLLSLSPTQYSVLYSKLYAELKKYLFNATNADGFDSDGFISFLISCYQ